MSPYLVNLKSNTMKKITLQMYNIHALFANISPTKVIHLKIFHIKSYTYHIITIRKQSIYSKVSTKCHKKIRLQTNETGF